jgi:DNA mismatch endonuclease (patch repair protein)
MADKFPAETRSKIMKSIRSRTKLEDRVCSELWRRGLRFRRNVTTLFGKPDIAIKKYKVVIFIDSCFWHYCPQHGHMPKSNIDYWTHKLYRNAKRDYMVNNYYIHKGWRIMRLWEHQIKANLDKCVQHIIEFVEQAKGEAP